MLRNILRILASSATFVAVVLVANITFANSSSLASQLGNVRIASINTAPVEAIDLNVISPSLNSCLSDSYSNSYSGCSCSICLGKA
ncbi:MAG: hypothetical protein AAGE96_24075 [Cyanobacteria bacterium P01_G01_bin.19]